MKEFDPDDFLSLGTPGHVWMPRNGFAWAEGIGASGFPDKFLWRVGDIPGLPVREQPWFKGGSRRPFDPEAYVRFAECRDTPEGLLAFGNEFGALGTRLRHHHIKADGSIRAGEAFRDWAAALFEYRETFRLWLAADSKNLREVRAILGGIRDRGGWGELAVSEYKGFPVYPRQMPVSGHLTLNLDKNEPIRYAKAVVVFRVNRMIGTRSVNLETICHACGELPMSQASRPAANVSCGLHFDVTATASSPTARFIAPTPLLMIWCEFANLVTGTRLVRPCEVCGRNMDVSTADRPTRKRMHDRCSRTKRMRTWRRKAHQGGGDDGKARTE